MQDDSGLNRLLTIGWVYDFFQFAAGSNQRTKWLAKNFWQCRPGERVVDMGCGTGSVLDYLPPDIHYVGYDISEDYITQAQQQFGNRGEFLVGTADEWLAETDERLMKADLVICNGLLHHLNDAESLDVLRLAKKILSPGGRMICLEPTFLVHQTWLSKWIVGRDRGRNVRAEQEWKALVGQVFDACSTQIATGLNRIPYVHIIIECRR